MSSKSILLVDDENDVREMVSEILTGAGYEVTAVGSGREAMGQLKRRRFALVLTDYRMEPVDGLDVLDGVKEADPEAMVIVFSGRGGLDLAVEAFRRRADDYLTKPLKAEELLLRIEGCLKKRVLLQEVRRSQQELALQEKALNALQQGIAIADARRPDHPVVYVNRGFTTLTGYSAEEVIGRRMNFLQGPETDAGTVGRISDCLRRGKEFFGEIVNYKKDGAPFWNLLKITPLDDEDGSLRYFIASLLDISRRKQMEASLQESEARFRQLAETIEDVFLLTTPDMERVLYVSPSYEAIWGLPAAALYDSAESRLEAVHPNDRLMVLSHFGRTIKEKYEIEYRILRSDGKTRWIRERGFPIREESGTVFRIAGILSDITEEKELRKEADQRLQQIVQADRLAALGEVVAGVAHEINNPNSFITYNIPLLEETWNIFRPILESHFAENPEIKIAHSSPRELMADMSEIIDAIKVGSERINRVVANLRDFARLDESALTRPVDVREAIEKTMTIVGAQLRRCADRIDLDLADGLPLIQGHAQKLEQVVANLLVNASHAVSEAASGRIRVATRYLDRIDAVLIDIEDNGGGISSAVLPRIFEPFFTTRRPSGGTGLGLSVSYGLVREHRGNIGVITRPGAGSRFTVYLPVGADTALDLHPTILCVDDDESVLKMVRSMLIKVEDEFVETTARPEQVLRYLETHPEVDIVLSDVSMPGINGWELLADIRRGFPMISMVLYSGHPEALNPPPGVDARPDAILSKPFEKFELVQTLSTIGRQRL